MTVIDNTPRDQYTATSGQTVFPYTFEISASGDIVVLQNGAILNEGTGAGQYGISGVGSDSGGNITLVTGATAGAVITLYRDMALDRLTSYTNGGDFLAADVNNDFDRLWLALQQNTGTSNRALVAPNTDPLDINMTIPEKAARLDKFLKFNSVTGNPEVSTISGEFAASGMNVYNFTGDGATVNFTLGTGPGGENNTQVYIDGVYQQKNTYNVSGSIVQFSTAPPNLSTIEVMVIEALPVGSASASQVSFTQAGSTYNSNVQRKLEESVSVKDFGAVGDGVTDDTVAIQAALNTGKNVFAPKGSYLVESQLNITVAGTSIVGETSAVFLLGSSNSGNLLAVKADRVSILNIHFNGQGNAPGVGDATEDSSLICVTSGQEEVVFDNCKIGNIEKVDSKICGLNISTNGCDVNVNNCTFYEIIGNRSADGNVADSKGVALKGSSISSGATKMKIIGCNFKKITTKYSGTATVHLDPDGKCIRGYWEESTYGVANFSIVVTGCAFEEFSESSAKLSGIKGIVFNDNVISCGWTSLNDGSAQESVYVYQNRNGRGTFSNNTVSGKVDKLIDTGGTLTTDVVVNGNVFTCTNVREIHTVGGTNTVNSGNVYALDDSNERLLTFGENTTGFVFSSNRLSYGTTGDNGSIGWRMCAFESGNTHSQILISDLSINFDVDASSPGTAAYYMIFSNSAATISDISFSNIKINSDKVWDMNPYFGGAAATGASISNVTFEDIHFNYAAGTAMIRPTSINYTNDPTNIKMDNILIEFPTVTATNTLEMINIDNCVEVSVKNVKVKVETKNSNTCGYSVSIRDCSKVDIDGIIFENIETSNSFFVDFRNVTTGSIRNVALIGSTTTSGTQKIVYVDGSTDIVVHGVSALNNYIGIGINDVTTAVLGDVSTASATTVSLTGTNSGIVDNT